MADDEEKSKKREKKNLKQTLAQLDKDYGKGVVMTGKSSIVDVNAIPSGIPAIDAALGIGGYPEGRIMEIYGPESCGKTTVALLAIAQVQKRGEVAAFIDAEHALDPTWARKLGVDMEKLLLSQPDSGEQAINICNALALSGEVSLIVIDSVAALVPQKELDGDIDDVVMAGTARLMSKGCRVLKGTLANNKCIVYFINQIREKVGVMFGSPETTPGGKALKYYASVRLRVQRGDAVKKGERAIGHVVKCKVLKNKVAPPFTTCEFNIFYGDPVAGIDYVECLFNAAKATKALVTRGSNYYIGERKIAVGGPATQEVLRNDAKLLEEVRVATYDAFKKCKTLEDMSDEELADTDETAGEEDGFEDEKE